MSDALMCIYKLIWDDFCAWYLEMVKPEFGKPIDKVSYNKTVTYFETLLKALHPFMPFITEELWHELSERAEKDCIITASWPSVNGFDQHLLTESTLAFDVIAEVRNTRNAKGLSPKEALKLAVKNNGAEKLDLFLPILKKLANLSSIDNTTTSVSNASSFVIRSMEFFIPMEGKIDAAKEKEALLKDLEYQKGFLLSIDKKLSNEKFVSSAKAEIVDNERKKKADAEAKIKAIEESLNRL